MKAEKAPKGKESPWSLGYWHLLVNPFHNILQKGSG
jgi:hypothetical protein